MLLLPQGRPAELGGWVGVLGNRHLMQRHAQRAHAHAQKKPTFGTGGGYACAQTFGDKRRIKRACAASLAAAVGCRRRTRKASAETRVGAMSNIEDVDARVVTRYEVGSKLGKGACALNLPGAPKALHTFSLPCCFARRADGIVWKATDRSSKSVVALKKIFDAFQNATDAQRTFREVIFLQQMSNHENIIGLKNLMKAENDKDLYLVFEFMETDLHAAIRANILEDVHKQYILYQSFKALQYMHSAGLVHRDMKPANLLLNAECLMKVADFGLARSILDETASSGVLEAPMCTDYVATRWYRAPEILVGSSSYGYQVDMWSMGCIFGEMLTGKPIFTGTTTLNQIEKIAEMLSLPTTEEVVSLKSQFAETLFDSVSANPEIPAAPEAACRPVGRTSQHLNSNAILLVMTWSVMTTDMPSPL